MFRIGFRRLSAPAAYYTQEGAAAFVFGLVFTIQAVYFVQSLGLTPLQLVLIGTVLELTCFLFEIPTGVIADTYSRRLSVVLGFACLGAGFLVLGFVPTFAGALLAQIVGGLGYTFLSGAQSAWITDEVGEEHVGRLFLRGSQVASVLGMVGVVVSALVGGLNLRVPIVAGGLLLLLLALALAVFMPERGFTPPPRADRASWRAMKTTFRQGVQVVRRSRVLTGLLVVALMYGASTEALDRLWQYHLLRGVGLPDAFGLRPAHWFGLIGLLGSFVGLFAVEAVRRRLDPSSVPATARALAVLTLLGIVAGVGFALAGQFWFAVTAFLTAGVLRGVYDPLYHTWLNQGLDSRTRATVISIAAQADALGQVAGGPAVGWLGNVSGARPALLATALLRLPTLWFFARVARAVPPEEGRAVEAGTS